MQRLRTLLSNPIKEHQVLALMLLLASLIGIAFVFIVPPWQHYDEPTQFEYAWLIANRPGLPGVGESDQALRRDIAASMIEHGFFRDLEFTPNLYLHLNKYGSAYLKLAASRSITGLLHYR